MPPAVTGPKYARDQLKAGILHFGVGNFHRAHQAVYLDELFNAGLDHDWALIGAGVRDTDRMMREALRAQDWLTTVVEQEANASSAHVTGAMIDFLEPFDIAATLEALARPEIRIVSLTITEGGYYISPATQAFDPTHPDIVWDAAHLDAPRTAFGLIVAGLKLRRAAGAAPFTVMSCDNIPGNGHVTENAVAGLAELVDPELAKWIRASVAFPNSMVDRITPATTDRERALARDNFGVEDAWPVFCEEFKQWVVEDHFPTGRPQLEKVGVTFTADVAPYELMKIRILNGGHAAIAYPAGLLDIHFVHEAMEDAQIRAFLKALTEREIIPHVPPPPNTDLERLPAADRAPVLQSEDRRHDLAPLPRRLQPPAEVHPADRGGAPRGGRRRGWPRAGFGAVVPIRLWRIGERQSDPAQRSVVGSSAGGGAAGADSAGSLSRNARHLWRARDQPGVCRGIYQRADEPVVARRARHVAGISGRLKSPPAACE